jgi:hypothetical protein
MSYIDWRSVFPAGSIAVLTDSLIELLKILSPVWVPCGTALVLFKLKRLRH